MVKILIMTIGLLAVFPTLHIGRFQAKEVKGGGAMTLTISSPAFSSGENIPITFTCDGRDISPALQFSGLPAAARSLVLIVDDPDAPDPKAPRMTWVHWLLYNMPPATVGLAENVSANGLPPGTREGLNDWHGNGYGGPCPPIGRHRYFFKLYALDTMLPDLGLPTKAALEKAMQSHIIEQAELIGTYRRIR
jgi:Raf kinase inhibitor-like YbhB/YbcL family protein